MENKRTLVLVAIALSTMLVTLIGTAFAYFSISSSAGSSTANVTGEVKAPGAISLSSDEHLYISLVPDDMTKEVAGDTGKTYYFTTTPNTTGSNKSLTEIDANVSKITVSGGSTGITYTCTGKVNIAATSDLDADTASITLKGVNETSKKILFDGNTTKTIDLKTGVTDQSVTMTFTKGDSDIVEYIKASAIYKNLSVEQPVVSIATSVVVSELNCTTGT